MSKKLLNESTIRRFAGLAGIGADVVSNFINEAYGEEEEVVSEEEESEEEDKGDMVDMDADADEEAEEEDMGDMSDMAAGDEEAEMDMDMMDMDAGAEGGDDAEALVSDIVAKLQDLAKMAGVDIDVEMGDEEEAEELEEMGMKYKRDEDEVMEEEEETLEEIINSILEEEDEIEEAKDEEMEEGLYGDGRHTKKESTIRREQEEVVQEVLRRVRARLAQKTKQ